MNLNKIQLAGNLTRDPELRFLPSGKAVCRIGVAVNRKWKSESGEPKEEVTFVDVDAFGKTAEAIGQYLKKGRGIFLEGRLKLEKWTDKQSGQERQKLGVILESFQFVDSQAKGGVTTAERAHPIAAAPTSGDAEPPSDDDVPF